MTPKMTALRNTAKILAIAIACGVVVSIILINLSMLEIAAGLAALSFVGLVKMIYDLELSKAECAAAFKKEE